MRMEPLFVGVEIMASHWMKSAALGILILSGGCSRTDNEPGPGGVTVSEAKALDDAAEMLESRDSLSDAKTDEAANSAKSEI